MEITQVIYTFLNMHKKSLLFILFMTICFASYVLGVSSCAQVAAPPGGKKDTLAPVLISTIPTQKSKNYTGKKIELIFNEYVDIKNVNQELLVTPGIGFYETKINPKGLSILVDSNFKKNTTYTFNFRNAVSDISERNVAKNVKVVFSTGETIDSLSIKGNVKFLENNKKVENALVALYPFTDTLNIEKIKPYYFTKTDTSGNYELENIAAGKYYMSSFLDNNNNLLVNTNKEPYDILKKPYIELTNSNSTFNFQLSLQNVDSLKILKTTTTAKTIAYDFNRGLRAVEITSKLNKKLTYQIENKNVVRLFKSELAANDTLYLSIKAQDSLFRTKTFQVKSVFRESNRKEKITRKPFNFNTYPRPGEKFAPTDSIQITFEKPIQSWNIRKIYLLKDSTEKTYFTEKELKLNTFNNQLIIPAKSLPIEKRKLIIDKNAFVSIEQDSTDAYELPIEKEDIENFGLIAGKLSNSKSKIPYIIQLIEDQSNTVSYEQTTTNASFSFNFIKPNIYTIRVIEDANSDGQWTPGNLSQKTLPERIFFLTGKLKLKANFELTDLQIAIDP